jgi:hypothetical protein
VGGDQNPKPSAECDAKWDPHYQAHNGHGGRLAGHNTRQLTRAVTQRLEHGEIPPPATCAAHQCEEERGHGEAGEQQGQQDREILHPAEAEDVDGRLGPEDPVFGSDLVLELGQVLRSLPPGVKSTNASLVGGM